MPIFKPNQKTYAMDPMDVPLASVAQGEAFTLFTENALDAEEGYFNPLTGPISVEGAKAGDTLAGKTNAFALPTGHFWARWALRRGMSAFPPSFPGRMAAIWM